MGSISRPITLLPTNLGPLAHKDALRNEAHRSCCLIDALSLDASCGPAFEELSSRSGEAEVAVIYLTGHEFEHRGRIYLMPNDYPFDEGLNRLSELAVDAASLTKILEGPEHKCRVLWGLLNLLAVDAA